MQELAAAREWLTVFQLPAYASELNPVESVWSPLKRSLVNLRQVRRYLAAPPASSTVSRADQASGSICGTFRTKPCNASSTWQAAGSSALGTQL